MEQEDDMSEQMHLSEALEGLFTTPKFFWFVTYPEAVGGLTAEQASRAPGPRFNSVWGVTLHLTICQRFAAAVLRGDPVDMNAFFAEGAWPPVREVTESAWETAKADVLAANHALAEVVSRLPAKALEQELPLVAMKGYAYIQGHLAHNSNHLNEIVLSRHLQDLWLEKT